MGLIVASAVLISACSGGSDSGSSASGSKPEKQMSAKKAKPAKAPKTAIKGTIRPGSKFSKISLGMRFSEVTSRIGGPSDMNTHETGKRWIPFYYGSDTKRQKVLYRGEGCLQFTGGNRFGGGAGKLVGITVDPSGACY